MKRPSRPEGILRRMAELLRYPGLHRDAFFMTAGTMTSAALGFFYWRFAARLYPTAVVGLASAGISSATFLAALANLGLAVGLVRFLPAHSPLEKSRLMTFSLLATTAAATVLAVFLAGSRWWAPSLDQASASYRGALAALTFALAWNSLQSAFLFAERRTPLFALRSLILSALQLLCILTLPARDQAVTVLWSILLPNLLLACALTWLNARLAHMPLFALGFTALPLGDLMRYSLGSLLFSLIWSLPAFVFPLLTLHRLGAAQNAYLTIAWQIYAFLAIIPNASASAFLIEGAHREHQVAASLRAAIKNNLVMLPPFILLIVGLTPFLLNLIAAEYARQAGLLLRLLALSALPVSMNSVTLTIYRIRKQVVRFNVLAATVIGLSLALAWLLLGPLGLNGIGVGWLGGQSLFLLASLPILVRESASSQESKARGRGLPSSPRQAAGDEGLSRIGILTYGLDRPPTGIGRYTIELLGALTAIAPEQPPTLLTPAPPRHLPQAERYPQRPLTWSRRLPALLTLGCLQLPRRTRGLSLLHDPGGNAPFLFVPDGIRLVVTIHDVFALAYPQTSTLLEKIIARFWLPLVLPKVDRVLTDSQASKADLLRYLPLRESQITVIHCGVGAEFRPLPAAAVAATLARYGLTAGYLLTVVGAQDRRRNLPRLLEAYRLLRKDGERRPLVIVGKPRRGAREVQDRQSSPSPEEGVQYLGYVPQDDLPALYHGAAVFVFPSLYEGFGMPPLEALACGVPVACSNVSALPEVVGDAALTFDPCRVEAIAAAVRRLLDDAVLRAELRERGLRRAARFTWEQTARATLAVYQELCNRA